MNSARQAAGRRINQYDRVAVAENQRAANSEMRQQRESRAFSLSDALRQVQLVKKAVDPAFAVPVDACIADFKRDEEAMHTPVPRSMTPRATRVSVDRPAVEARVSTHNNKRDPRQAVERRSPGPTQGSQSSLRSPMSPVELINVKLPVRSTIRMTEAGKAAEARFFSSISFEPGPGRDAVKSARAAKVAQMVRPNSTGRAAFTPRSPGSSQKVPKDFVPRVASALPADHGAEAAARRSPNTPRNSLRF